MTQGNNPGAPQFTGQVVVEQSMMIANGGSGYHAFYATKNTNILTRSTLYGNAQDRKSGSTAWGELTANVSSPTILNVIAESSRATQTQCSTHAADCGAPTVTINVYAAVCFYCNSVVQNSTFRGVNGQHYQNRESWHGYQWNFQGTGNNQNDPQFTNPVLPTSTPNCNNSKTVVECMSTIIANFTPQNRTMADRGYKPPGPCAADPYWPTWIPTNVIPDGIITKPCAAPAIAPLPRAP